MSSWYLSFEREIVDVDPMSIDLRALPSVADELDALAESMGLAPLMSFASMPADEASEFLKAHDVEDVAASDEQWFAPAIGLKTVRGLLAAMESGQAEIPNPDQVIDDLEELENVFEILQTVGVRFHLSIDI